MTTAGQTPSPMRQPLLATFVVGVDSSPESLYALEQAALIGASHGATLRVVHVHPHPGALGFSPMASAEFERSQDQLDEMVKAEAGRIKERATLKHRGGSKFMKRQIIYGKYNDKVM